MSHLASTAGLHLTHATPGTAGTGALAFVSLTSPGTELVLVEHRLASCASESVMARTGSDRWVTVIRVTCESTVFCVGRHSWVGAPTVAKCSLSPLGLVRVTLLGMCGNGCVADT